MSVTKQLLTISLLFSGLEFSLLADKAPNRWFDGASDSIMMAPYRVIYEKKSKKAKEVTILCDAHSKELRMNCYGDIGLADGEIISKPHDKNYFLIGEKIAGPQEIAKIADFIYVEEALALSNNKEVLARSVRECWDYYKFSICLFFRTKSIKKSQQAMQEKINRGPKAKELALEAIEATSLYNKFRGPSRFNMNIEGVRVDQINEEQENIDQQDQKNIKKKGYKGLRQTMKYTSPYKQRAISSPKISHKDESDIGKHEHITPSQSTTIDGFVEFIKPAGKKPPVARVLKKNLK